MNTTRRTRVVVCAAVGAVAAVVGLGAYATGSLRGLEAESVAARFDLRGTDSEPSNLAVVVLDETTLAKLPYTWPFSRCVHARVIEQIVRRGPLALAVDIGFTDASDDVAADGTSCDRRLLEVVADAGNVVLSAGEIGTGGRVTVVGATGRFPRVGNPFIPVDADGVSTRVPPAVQGVKSLGVVAAEVAAGRAIPAPGRDAWIDFAGPTGTMRSYSYSRVLAGDVPRSAFAGRLVVLGPAASSLLGGNVRTSAGDGPMSTTEAQANVARTALLGFPLRSTPLGWTVALIVLFAALPAAAGLRARGWRLVALALLAAAAFTVSVQLAFEHGRVVVFAYPLLALAIGTVGVVLLGRLLEAFGRSRDALSRFVPDAVASKVLSRSAAVPTPGGELVVGTVMFTDLRGFTAVSERLAACDVIGLLNGYFGEMSGAVLGHGGTLVSYLGDGLMAVFGAPAPQDDHADRALAAAREMLELRLPKVNERLLAQGFERGFKMGIGLNSGQFVSGIVGSRQRLEYTAVGDTINTASRIEGMTKGTPHALLLAESTKQALLRPVDDLVYIDELPVRGRTHPIRLWSLSAEYVLKEDWESEAVGAEPTATEGSEEPVPA